MKKITTLLYSVIAVVLLSLVGLSWTSHRAAVPGLGSDGRLTPCPDRPNCASSEDGDLDPLSFTGSPEAARENNRQLIEQLGGTIEREEGNYMAATFRSPLFRFVDDMEFRMVPEENLIHFRSASRVGHSDMGVNRKRVEAFRDRL
ncbi:MAG: DUF1499 domain-containing protein [Kiritimatiellae bacterium]|nr:DUF1499 domain-containing protein [Kiritimatiellia bacterium]